MKHDIDLTWEYAVCNEQYSRKNNLRILGIDEQEGEDLEGKFISCMRENLGEEVKPEEVEIIHHVGPKKFTVGNAGNSTGDQQEINSQQDQGQSLSVCSLTRRRHVCS